MDWITLTLLIVVAGFNIWNICITGLDHACLSCLSKKRIALTPIDGGWHAKMPDGRSAVAETPQQAIYLADTSENP